MKEEHTNDYSQEAIRASYAYGHIEAWLEVFTRSHGLSYPIIANRVGELLQAQTSREVLGTNHRVPSMQAAPTRRYRTKRVKALEMAEHASGSQSPQQEAVTAITNKGASVFLRSRKAIAQHRYYHDPNKGQYSRAVLAVLAKKNGTLTGPELVDMVKLKNPDWKPQQIWGALNVAVKHQKIEKRLRLGQWYLHLGKA